MRGRVIELVDAQVECALRGLPDEVVRRPGADRADVVRVAQAFDDRVEIGARTSLGPKPRDSHAIEDPTALPEARSPKPEAGVDTLDTSTSIERLVPVWRVEGVGRSGGRGGRGGHRPRDAPADRDGWSCAARRRPPWTWPRPRWPASAVPQSRRSVRVSRRRARAPAGTD